MAAGLLRSPVIALWVLPRGQPLVWLTSKLQSGPQLFRLLSYLSGAVWIVQGSSLPPGAWVPGSATSVASP